MTKEIPQALVADLISERFGRYAKYIIQERALPDIRDGLKPVQRRILYAMISLGMIYEKHFRKSARVVGEVIGKYHPHGDSSVYDALVKLTQNWKKRTPLIVMQGNNGSWDGDTPAAMRYTEVKLNVITQDYLLQYLEPKIIDYQSNFDDTVREPVVLPATLPFLLMNGATGIAAGYATNIPPHNLPELVSALIFLVDHPDATLSDLLKIIKGPDFPTGGLVTQNNLHDIYATGQGALLITARIVFQKNTLVVVEIPFGQNKSQIYLELKKIAATCPELRIKQVLDESDRTGMKIKIYCKKNNDLSYVQSYLLKHSHLSTKFHVNMVALDHQRPYLFNLLSYLQQFITFHRRLLVKVIQKKLQKILSQLHLLQGILLILPHLNAVISLMRKARDRVDVIRQLSQKFGLSSEQANFLADWKLYRLSQAELAQISTQVKTLQQQATTFTTLLNNSEQLSQYQIDHWKTASQLHGSARLTTITSATQIFAPLPTQQITFHPVLLCLTRDGYTAQVVAGVEVNDDWWTQWKFKDHDVLVFRERITQPGVLFIITNFGYAAQVTLEHIGQWKKQQALSHLGQWITWATGEKIVYAQWLPRKNDFTHLTLCTSSGRAKTIHYRSIKAITIRKKKIINLITARCEVISACFWKKTSDDPHPSILLITAQGRVLYSAPTRVISVQSLLASGMQFIRLVPDDRVVFVSFDHQEDTNNNKYLILMTTQWLIFTILVADLKLNRSFSKGQWVWRWSPQRLSFQKAQSPQISTAFIATRKKKKIYYCYQQQLQTYFLNLNLKRPTQLLKQLNAYFKKLNHNNIFA